MGAKPHASVRLPSQPPGPRLSAGNTAATGICMENISLLGTELLLLIPASGCDNGRSLGVTSWRWQNRSQPVWTASCCPPTFLLRPGEDKFCLLSCLRLSVFGGLNAIAAGLPLNNRPLGIVCQSHSKPLGSILEFEAAMLEVCGSAPPYCFLVEVTPGSLLDLDTLSSHCWQWPSRLFTDAFATE